MLKWIVRIGLIIIVGVFGCGVYAYFALKSAQPPAISDAPLALQAYYNIGDTQIPTRYYYAENIAVNEGVAVLDSYWTYDGERFHKHDGSREVEPPFTIIKRVR